MDDKSLVQLHGKLEDANAVRGAHGGLGFEKAAKKAKEPKGLKGLASKAGSSREFASTTAGARRQRCARRTYTLTRAAMPSQAPLRPVTGTRGRGQSSSR